MMNILLITSVLRTINGQYKLCVGRYSALDYREQKHSREQSDFQ